MAFSRQSLFGKLDTTLFRSIESATTLCKLKGNPYVELVHWMVQLWQQEQSDLRQIVRHFQLDIQLMEKGMDQALLRLPSGASSISDFSYHIEMAIERAWVCASLEYSESAIRSGHLLLACLTTTELRRALSAISPVFDKIPLDILASDLAFITKDSPEAEQNATDNSDLGGKNSLPGEASSAMAGEQGKATLAQYTTDLTALAREGKIDPVIGREQEINTMIDILLRRRQNNPLLTGEAGVGKTALVEGMALAIASGHVPPPLAKVRLLNLDIVALSAGASMKGEFESRLKSVLEEAVASPNPVILFVDEVHTLVGAGGNSGTGDAANLLKPALARGKLRTIGATTWSEFKRHIEKDPALTRRFQVLQVDEPSEEKSVAMLRGLVPMLEKHHSVWIMEEALQSAVRLSHRYIPARQLPDKAISLLDTACARVAVAQNIAPKDLQELQYKTQTASSELSLAEKALNFGREDSDTLNALQDNIKAQTALAEEMEARWLKEKSAVAAIVEIRSQIQALISGDKPADTPAPAAEESHAAAAETGDTVVAEAVTETVVLSEKEQLAELQKQLAEQEKALEAIRHNLREDAVIQAEVNAAVVASIVADWTGIPVGRMMKDELNAVLELPNHLAERVIGQQHALDIISESIQTSRAGLADPRKPIGVFMLVGPSGVGKTETALAIAEQLYGGEQNVITINMSEYQEAHTVSSLKGSPPGYVGYGEGGVLTEAVRRKPYSVVLLDEVEKAHPDVHELFFQVFDKGRMEDGEGRVIDFKNTIILLTSNAGSDLISSLSADPDTPPDLDGMRTALQPELLKVFPAAFLGRLSVVPYYPLQDESLGRIVRIHLDRVGQRLSAQHNAAFEYGDDVVDSIISQCSVAETGARILIRFIEQNILPKIGLHILNRNTESAIQKVILSCDNQNGFTVTSE
ncbi:type VI secretion system ATPase TssH [Morganella morganii]|uniref:type VI secretion system ATPase TssH n=1 Tax=Morganella morganii TaxID=582 RepID=UPI0028072F5D|nr:type VI secretion system ATPase TssH [Morganella morganii subsp. sibonii]HDU8311659.1 type VI secretion system ATPase TssH [Morganella morganii subsp. sibonii]